MITSREELKEYCFRRLGHPVIEINVDDDQVEDRIDDAIQYFSEYHFDGVQKMFMHYTITQDDIDNKYLDIPNHVMGINNVHQVTGGSLGMFDIRYQFMLNEVFDFSSTSLLHYDLVKRHLATLNMVLGHKSSIRFNRLTNKLYLDTKWDLLSVGSKILIEGYRTLDPSESPRFWDDMFLKLYTTALIKQQWGANLIKFSGITLPGGVSLDGQKIYDDATTELNELKEKMITDFTEPVNFFIG